MHGTENLKEVSDKPGSKINLGLALKEFNRSK
jgi:hypothetical protein